MNIQIASRPRHTRVRVGRGGIWAEACRFDTGQGRRGTTAMTRAERDPEEALIARRRNENPRPLVWIKAIDGIPEKVYRGRTTLTEST